MSSEDIFDDVGPADLRVPPFNQSTALDPSDMATGVVPPNATSPEVSKSYYSVIYILIVALMSLLYPCLCCYTENA